MAYLPAGTELDIAHCKAPVAEKFAKVGAFLQINRSLTVRGGYENELVAEEVGAAFRVDQRLLFNVVHPIEIG